MRRGGLADQLTGVFCATVKLGCMRWGGRDPDAVAAPELAPPRDNVYLPTRPFNLRTTTSQKCAAVPRRTRIRLESNKEEEDAVAAPELTPPRDHVYLPWCVWCRVEGSRSEVCPYQVSSTSTGQGFGARVQGLGRIGTAARQRLSANTPFQLNTPFCVIVRVRGSEAGSYLRLIDSCITQPRDHVYLPR